LHAYQSALWQLGLFVFSGSVESSKIFQTIFLFKMPLKIFLPADDLDLCRKAPISLLLGSLEAVYPQGGERRVGLIKIIAND